MSESVKNSLSDRCMKLDQYRLVEIIGDDAEKYLQGQLTCNVVKLAVGEQTLTAHCDPKGKMSALFRLFRQGECHFIAIMPQDLLPEALVQLKKYAVFSKVSFTEKETPIYGTTSGEMIAKFCEKATACRLSGEPERTLFWGDVSPETNAESQLWDLIDIQQGVPLLFKTNQFELIPQAVNLQCLEQAISFTKGCYIGQETIARAKYRGANKRAMFTMVADFSSDLPLPDIGGSIELQLGEHLKNTGTVLAVVPYQQKVWLQIVLNKEVELDSQCRFGELQFTIVPLPYSLDEN